MRKPQDASVKGDHKIKLVEEVKKNNRKLNFKVSV